MDLGLIGALALLLIWAIAALVLEGPGWVHLLLTIAVSLIIYRVVARSAAADTPASPTDQPKR